MILNQRVEGARPSVLVRGVEQSGSSSGSIPEGHWFKSSLRNIGDCLLGDMPESVISDSGYIIYWSDPVHLKYLVSGFSTQTFQVCRASLKKGAFLHVEKEHEILVMITLAINERMFYNANTDKHMVVSY